MSIVRIPRSRSRIVLQTAGIFLLILLTAPPGRADSPGLGLESSYRFLVGDRDTEDGILYLATAGKLRGRRLPLSFADTPEYWGEYVCRLPANTCSVIDVYDPGTSSLTPEPSLPGDLQTERTNIHNGANIYDAATWQIGVMLGHALNRFSLPNNQDIYALVNNQNSLLVEGYNGNSSLVGNSENRAVTAGKVFIYNQAVVTDPEQAYAFRMLPRNWLSSDPLMGTRYADLITTSGLPPGNPDYQPGKVSWSDWKPITGENAWAFLLGPLQAAYIHHRIARKSAFIPVDDPAVRNALAILPTFAAMQSPSGAIYYAPAGTVANQGNLVVDPYTVAVENTISLYAGLNVLHETLQGALKHEKNLDATRRRKVLEALALIRVMIDGGEIGTHRATSGLLHFFRYLAWRNGEFVQGGLADTGEAAWLPNLKPRAVDVNTWGIAALGPGQIDAWFGFGAAFRNWQQVKQWGGYGVGKVLWGVGFSDQDGNGIDADGNFRQGILSSEWTAGAITMVRSMISRYRKIPAQSQDHGEAQHFLAHLGQDEQAMVAALAKMRLDIYTTTPFPGKPEKINEVLPLRQTLPYVYASRRYLIPFGWYANPLPSTCATAWAIMVGNGYNPFAYGGSYEKITPGEVPSL